MITPDLLDADQALLWRCVKCGKWSHAQKKPQSHKRYTEHPKPDETIVSYDHFGDGGSFVSCGPFEPWIAYPERLETLAEHP